MGTAAMGTAAEWLEANGAQHDAVSWARAFGDDWQALWDACPRGDWLLAIGVRRGLDAARLRDAARAVATLALDHLEGAEREEARQALAEAGDAAAFEARAEASPDPVHGAALSAIALALRGTADELAIVPAMLVQAAALDAADCGMSAAVGYVQRRSAELVRETLPSPCF
jgi:hypothetical protein